MKKHTSAKKRTRKTLHSIHSPPPVFDFVFNSIVCITEGNFEFFFNSRNEPKITNKSEATHQYCSGEVTESWEAI